MERAAIATITYDQPYGRYYVSLGILGGKSFDRYADAQSWAYTHALIVRGLLH